jgi:probable F420-dependent oxidoreductase
MRIGVKLPTSGPVAGPEAIRTIAETCDELGYHSLWVQDHVSRSSADAEHHFGMGAWEAWTRPITPNFYGALSTLSYLAGITKRVRLGASAMVLPLHNPVWLAKTMADIDQLSGGRATLGAVSGGAYVRRELAAIGRPELAERRGRVVEEYLDVIEGIWTEDRFSYAGEFIRVEGAEVFPKPLQEPLPIWIGGFGPRPLDRAVRRGVGWLGIWRGPHQMTEGKALIAERAAEHGRDPDEILLASEGWLSIDVDAERARHRALATRHKFSGYINELPSASDDLVEDLKGNEDDYSMIGDPADVVAKLREYEAVGVDEMNLRVIAGSLEEAVASLQLFSEEVLPAINSARRKDTQPT